MENVIAKPTTIKVRKLFVDRKSGKKIQQTVFGYGVQDNIIIAKHIVVSHYTSANKLLS